jgi:hypothetical protein
MQGIEERHLHCKVLRGNQAEELTAVQRVKRGSCDDCRGSLHGRNSLREEQQRLMQVLSVLRAGILTILTCAIMIPSSVGTLSARVSPQLVLRVWLQPSMPLPLAFRRFPRSVDPPAHLQQ